MNNKEKAANLLKQMTLREKIGQLNQRLYGFNIYERKGDDFILSEEFKEEVSKWGGLGVLYGLYRADPWSQKDFETGITPDLSKKAYNLVQEYVMEHSRLKIPFALSSECPHGHQALEGGLLPVNTACGATFDEELLQEAYKTVGKQLKDGHVNLALMSVLDVLRDPRWGRSEECYSEDPVLSARLARAAISGMQENGVAAVAKHLCAQGEGTGGVNASAASIGERELRDIHLQAIKSCAKAGVKGVMAAYNEIDGVYCHANKWLLKKVLREEYGFDGIVMADGFAVDAMRFVAGNEMKAGALALNSGVDVSLWDQGFSRLEEAVEEGLVDEKQIDEAVLRVLEHKFEQGLFDAPFMEENMKAEEDYGIDVLSERLAKESVILLKNNGVLPIKEKKRIAVIGANADSVYALLGDYTPPRDSKKAITILQGLKEVFKESSIDFFKNDDFKPEDYDLVIAVGGGSSSRYIKTKYDKNGAALSDGDISDSFEEYMECGEGMDASSLEMPGHILERVERLNGKVPVVLIVCAGRPYALGKIEPLCDAILYAFYPGPWGARPIAEILKGKTAPSGRLPASIPRSTGQVPCYYNYKESYQGIKYCNEKRGALYSFGYGLTYGDIIYENIRLQKNEGQSCKIIFDVTNRSQYENAAIPQLYIHRLGGSVTARVKELKNFKRINLLPGEKRSVVLELEADDFIYYDQELLPTNKADGYEIILMDMGKELYKGEIR